MSLSDDGYEIRRGYFRHELLVSYETAVAELYEALARKVEPYRRLPRPGVLSLGDRLAVVYEAMEDGGDWSALYEVQKMLPGCRKLWPLLEWAAPMNFALIEGPGLFINRPGVDRLLYRWHSEAHYYPKRRRFLNLWWPLFGDKHAGNGTMSVLPGSHLREWPFAEYDGDRPGHFVQYEVPESLLGEFTETPIEAARGDLVIFDRNLIHRSNPNLSDRISVAGVARVWDPTDDLTLSGTMAATPYGGDVGRAGLVVS